MRFLISFVNSSLSLGGFDWKTGELFWQISADRLRACGICYHENSLLISSDDEVRRFTPSGQTAVRLPGPYPSQAHSLHMIDGSTFGVADTGNSVVRVYSTAFEHQTDLAPFSDWPQLPDDAVHLNDFAVTPYGIIASCFDFRPWRAVQSRFKDRKLWSTSGMGVLINISDGHGAGRLVGCGLNHPHTLLFSDQQLFNCSSSQGIFHSWQFTESGTLSSIKNIPVTQDHFLRGACRSGGKWYLGGSTARHNMAASRNMAVYRINESSGTIERRPLPTTGEIYDIVPWKEDIMEPIIKANLGNDQ